jgi:AsmA protein
LGLENLHAQLLKSQLEGFFRINGLQDLPVEGHLATSLNLNDLKQAIPLDSLDLGGNLTLNLDVKGNYAPDKKLFPQATIDLKIKEGTLLTKYYPHPIENINVDASITNSTGKLADTRIKLTPLAFTFEGKPMSVIADLSNPDNLRYDITSKGSIDVGKVYKVFSRKGMDLDGYISTDLKLKGTQSDALAGNYSKLNNSGRLELRDIAFTSEYLLKPFVIKTGVFRFENDKIRFEKFEGRYEASDITLDGYLNNVINYALSPNQKLKGSFTFKSNYLLADEFMVPNESGSSTRHPASKAENQEPRTGNRESGVIMVPENLEIGLKVDAKKISFNKIDFNNLTASVEVKQGMLLLKGMNFELIGCKVSMDATYGSISPAKAFFDFHIIANDFDIKRAYNEVELFRNLSTSAGKCEGIVSLDYSLKGKVDADMKPVYPSLEGGGVLSLKKIKVMGLALFTSMSKNLEKDKIKNPDLSKVDLKTTIKNNVITLEKTKMKISGFRFRIAGETNFNGALNFKARLGLPPLGIVGIPIRILGTQDNPRFKYGKGNQDEDVEETNYSDEIPKDLLDKIKNAKEEELKDEDPGK